MDRERYYHDRRLGVVGVNPGHQSLDCTWLPNRTPQYTWIRTVDLYATRTEAEKAPFAVFPLAEPKP